MQFPEQRAARYSREQALAGLGIGVDRVPVGGGRAGLGEMRAVRQGQVVNRERAAPLQPPAVGANALINQGALVQGADRIELPAFAAEAFER